MRFLFYLLAMLPGLAQAQGTFEPASGSKAMVLLASLFGGLEVFGSSGVDPFKEVVSVFNGAVLMIGGLLVGYNIVAGTLNTAHDGELLGKKFSSVWLPIRTSLGTALVLPVFGGYCVMQKMVAMVIVMSIGLADQAWITYVSKDNLQKNIQIGLVRLDAKQLGYTILKSEVCMAALSKVVTNNPDAAILGGGNSIFGPTTKTLADSTTRIEFGDKNQYNGFATDTCGSIEVPNSQEVITFPVQTGIWSSSTAFADSQARMERIVAEQKNQLNTMITAMQSQAQTLVSSGTKLDAKAIDKIINNYELAIRDKAASEILGIDVFKEVSSNASNDGFIGAATFYNKMIFLTDLVQRSMAKVPTAKGPSTANIANTFYDTYEQSFQPLLATLDETAKGRQYGISYEAGGSNNQAKCDGMIDCFSKKIDINAVVKSTFTEGRRSFVFQQGEHPVMALKRIGNSFLMWASGLFIASLALWGTIAQAPGWAVGLAAAFFTFVPMLAVAGFTLSFVIPFMPTIIIVSAILGWLVMCVEAIFIAPCWAVMHLTANGDDMVGSGAQGYRLVLSLMLKPVLLVFGIIASIVLLQVMGDFIASIFQDTFLSLNEDSPLLILVLSSVFYGLVYGSLIHTVIKRIFNLITEVPDSVLKWITNSDNQLGQSASQIAGGNGAFVAAAAVVSKGGESTASLGKDLKEQKKALDKEEAASKFESMDNKVVGQHGNEVGSGNDSSSESGSKGGNSSQSYVDLAKSMNTASNQGGGGKPDAAPEAPKDGKD
ncbi:DotA/TraY family protein [Massilia sp. WG5]|uniref:DotA/TraY family protein n=1 Tax=Massilia sp. WG5 TaxID=1707785 RepID=UPI0009E9C57C|nr:DotA/TraY family protein [Massilia sp. WG5]